MYNVMTSLSLQRNALFRKFKYETMSGYKSFQQLLQLDNAPINVFPARGWGGDNPREIEQPKGNWTNSKFNCLFPDCPGENLCLITGGRSKLSRYYETTKFTLPTAWVCLFLAGWEIFIGLIPACRDFFCCLILCICPPQPGMENINMWHNTL